MRKLQAATVSDKLRKTQPKSIIKTSNNMENKESKNEILNFLIKGSDNLANNVVKALLFGFIVGAFFYYWGRDFDFDTPYSLTNGIISGVVVAGGLFLKYNSNK